MSKKETTIVLAGTYSYPPVTYVGERPAPDEYARLQAEAISMGVVNLKITADVLRMMVGRTLHIKEVITPSCNQNGDKLNESQLAADPAAFPYCAVVCDIEDPE